MKIAATVGAIYGGLLLVGGIIGYAAQGSIASIVMGGLTGLAALASAWGMFHGSRWGWYGALGVAIALTVYFGNTFWQSRDWMPAGSIGALSLTATLLLVYLVRRDRRQ
jgi:uncharacterized membrane protein (UPF0136 family)